MLFPQPPLIEELLYMVQFQKAGNIFGRHFFRKMEHIDEFIGETNKAPGIRKHAGLSK